MMFNSIKLNFLNELKCDWEKDRNRQMDNDDDNDQFRNLYFGLVFNFCKLKSK